MADPTQTVDYKALKTWIAVKEAYEVATGSPAPLTPAQSKAVAELTKCNPSPLTKNGPLGDMDYISILHNYVNASKGDGTTVTYSGAISVPSPSPSPSPQWTQTLTLRLAPSSPPLVFPSHRTGGLVHGAAPSFPRVRDATKYAAQTCVDWLVSKGSLVSSTSPGGGGQLALVPSACAERKRKGVSDPTALDARDDSVPATQRVAELCRRLGWQAPSYKLEAVGAAGSGVWDCEADFGRNAHEVQLPERGRVRGVYSRKRAKEAVAERVLEYLLLEERRREMMGRMMEERDDEEGSEEDSEEDGLGSEDESEGD